MLRRGAGLANTGELRPAHRDALGSPVPATVLAIRPLWAIPAAVFE
jgi:hypothetical protein